MRRRLKRVMSIIIIPVLASLLVACGDGSSDNSDVDLPDSGYTENIGGEDDLFADVVLNPIELKGIVVDGVNISDLQLVQFGADKLDDGSFEAIQEAYNKIYEGADINVENLIKDVGTTAAVVTVYVTLSTVGGPIGTFAGAVITSEFTAGALAVGAAIDAFSSAYTEYQNSHDWERTIGHALNGVANGAKWGAILAPAEVAGIQGLKLVGNKITATSVANVMINMDGLSKLPNGTRKAIYENLEDFMDETYGLSNSASKEELEEIATRLSKKLNINIDSKTVKGFINNREKIVSVASKKGFSTVKDKVISTTKTEFFKNANLSDEASQSIVKSLEKGKIKAIADITTDKNSAKYIVDNFDTLKSLFPNNVTKEFATDCLSEKIGREAFDSMADMKSSKFIFSDLVDSIGIEKGLDLINTNSGITLIDAAFDSKTVNKLLNTSEVFKAATFGKKDLSSSDITAVNEILHNIFDGKLKSINDLSQDYNTIKSNLLRSADIFNINLKALPDNKRASQFVDDLAANAIQARQNGDIFSGKIVDIEDIKTILKGKTNKSRILNMENGPELYESFLKNPNQALTLIGSCKKPNTTIMKDILNDTLTNKGVSDKVIKDIIDGKSVASINFTKEITDEVGDIIASYYQNTNSTKYDEYIGIYSELRGIDAKRFYESIGKKPIKFDEYAGKVAKAPNELIAKKYGEIRYSSAGEPIFDKYAIARVKIDNLKGLEEDLRDANSIHHTVTDGISGYTWHHLEDGKTLILIPTDLHKAYAHSGGATLIRKGAFK